MIPLISRMRIQNAYVLTGHSRPQRPRSFWSAPRIATSGQVQQRSPRFTDFPSLCACSESSLSNLIGSGLNLLCLQSHSKKECRWTWAELAILGADQKERGLWGRECSPVNEQVEISLFCTGHLIGWSYKCCNLLFQFCLLIGFHCLGGPGFSKRTVKLLLFKLNTLQTKIVKL